MRTNIEIDDALLSQAMTATGLPTKRATVEEGLRMLVRMRKQAKAFADLKGLGDRFLGSCHMWGIHLPFQVPIFAVGL